MTKTIDEQLERLASAQERSARALEGIFEVIANFKFEQVGNIAVAGVSIPEEDNAGANDEAATEEVSVNETETPEEEVQEEAVSDPEPEPEDTGDEEEAAEAEAAGEDGDEGDPLGDGDAAEDEQYALPEKLTNDTLRGFARDLMEKEGKAAVFEVLADIGTGYKAVGEVSKDDLKEAHLKMAERLKG